MNSIRKSVLALAAVAAFALPAAAAPPTAGSDIARESIGQHVQKELVTLPFYGVFDNLAYQVEGDTVTLYGQVVRPTTKTSAEKRVSRIDGVRNVVNRIEVLPLSPNDDRIRAQAYRQIFRTASLYRYAMGANPSLHIVVNRGHLTLEGVVANRADSQLAYMAARQIPGVFSVTNNLRLASEM